MSRDLNILVKSTNETFARLALNTTGEIDSGLTIEAMKQLAADFKRVSRAFMGERVSLAEIRRSPTLKTYIANLKQLERHWRRRKAA
jgi:hypothetical protein